MVYVRDLLRGAKDAKFTAKAKRSGHMNVPGKGEGRCLFDAHLFRPGLLTVNCCCNNITGSDLTIQDIERILHYMVIESILREQFEVQQPYGTVVAYMQV